MGGGVPFQGGQLESGDTVFVLRCAEKDGRMDNLASKAVRENVDEVDQAYEAILASLAWA